VNSPQIRNKAIYESISLDSYKAKRTVKVKKQAPTVPRRGWQ